MSQPKLGDPYPLITEEEQLEREALWRADPEVSNCGNSECWGCEKDEDDSDA